MSEKKPPQSFEETYAKLKLGYIERLQGNFSEIQDVLRKIKTEPLSYDDVLAIRVLAHGLAGSGTTFGYPDITSTGRQTEQFVEKIIKTMRPNDLVGEDAASEITKLLNEMGAACDMSSIPENLITNDIDFADPKSPSPSLGGKSRLVVLVVDDDRNMTTLAALKLTQREFSVITAHDGAEALESIKKRRPDLIILDVNMPVTSGHDVLRTLKQDPDYASIPVLMLTASAKQEDVVGALHSGAIDYIVKPIDINDLVARVEKLCRNLRHTVLIADNDQLILTLLNHRFIRKGLNVILADTGTAAWDSIQKFNPDIIILDIMMPGMDGFEVMSHMRKNPETENIPVIVLSSNKSEEQIDAAMKAGAREYVIKPITTDNLLSRCLDILNKKDN